MMDAGSFMKRAVVGLVLFAAISTAEGHVTIQPKQSIAGATEKYTIRVPTEKFVPTVRVEVQFPADINVFAFEPKDGWKIEEKKDPLAGLLGPF